MALTGYDPNIDEWIYLIRGNHIEHCKEQELAIENNIIPVLERKDVYVDSERIRQGLSLEKYFPYKLLPWERYQFAVIVGVFLRMPGMPYDDIYFHEVRDIMGRGSGKNGFIDFLALYFISPFHGVKGYNVDLIANGEDQAGTSIKDVAELIREPIDPRYEKALQSNFRPYGEKVVGKKMHAEFRLNTTSTKNKDSKRTGCIIFDEKHQYRDTRNMNTLRSGLGKMKWSREITITTDGHERDGVLDKEKAQNEIILREYDPNNRVFINWFRIEKEEEWSDIDKIVKANPSIADPSFFSLRQQIQDEIIKMPNTPDYFYEFLAKRCNFPLTDPQYAVAEWSDIEACTRKPAFELVPGMSCVGGVDYTKTNDFCGCVLIFRQGVEYVTIHHSFICKKSRDLPHIKAPIDEWVKAGYCTVIDDVEISPDIPVQWFQKYAEKYSIEMIGIDNYRYTWLNKHFTSIGFNAFDKNNKNIFLVRPSEIAKTSAIVNSIFLQHTMSGWDRMMCWYTNNTKKMLDAKGNISYGKIEPNLRKTDGFQAYVHAVCCIGYLPEDSVLPEAGFAVMSY